MWVESTTGTGGGTARIKTGTFTPSSSGTVKITCNFRPKYITVYQEGGTTYKHMVMYNADYSTSLQMYAQNNGNLTQIAVPQTSGNNRLASVDNDGFTLRPSSASFTSGYYFAATE